VRELMASLARMLETCTEAVLVEMSRRRAISPLERPARRAATSRSRGEVARAVGCGRAVAEAAQEGGGLVAGPAGPALQQAGGLAGVVEGGRLVAEGEQAAGGALVAVGQQVGGPVEVGVSSTWR